MTWEDYDQAPGWPQDPLPVRKDATSLFPGLVTERRRFQCKLADLRYREKVGWPKRDRARAREIEAAYRRRKRMSRAGVAP